MRNFFKILSVLTSLITILSVQQILSKEFKSKPQSHEIEFALYNPNSILNNDMYTFNTGSDTQLYHKIEEIIKLAPYNERFKEVRFQITQGNVILSGYVERISDKIDVESRVKSINGVKFVENQIKVREKPPAFRPRPHVVIPQQLPIQPSK